jgi:hypothetical protein
MAQVRKQLIVPGNAHEMVSMPRRHFIQVEEFLSGLPIFCERN